MSAGEQLLGFVRAEFDAEAAADFPRLSRVPDSLVAARIDHYRGAPADERAAFASCCAWQGHIALAVAVGADVELPTAHPYFERWAAVRGSIDCPGFDQRMAVRWAREEQRNALPLSMPAEAFGRAAAVEYVKAAELSKRVRAALQRVGLEKVGRGDWYEGRRADGSAFAVSADVGSRLAQLRIEVAPFAMSMGKTQRALAVDRTLAFDRVFGMGHGHWDAITAANVDDVFELLPVAVAYTADLPGRAGFSRSGPAAGTP